MKQLIFTAVFAFTTLVFALLWIGSLTVSNGTKEVVASNTKVTHENPIEATDDTVLTFTESTLKKFFTYNNDNYLTRFNELENRADRTVVQKMKLTAATEMPEIQFNNEVLEIQSFLDPRDRDSVLVVLKTRYTLAGGNTHERKEIINAEVVKNKGQWIIKELEHQGELIPENPI